MKSNAKKCTFLKMQTKIYTSSEYPGSIEMNIMVSAQQNEW